MSTNNEFLAPRLTGKRFEDHSIPLEVLEDFAAFEELVIEVAKFLYFEENPGRQRVPRGFTEGVSLKLSSIEDGSAIPKIILATALSTAASIPSENIRFFEDAKARIIQSIDAAEKNENITHYIPEKFLGYFNRIGKRLKEDESIEFAPNSQSKARLNRTVRKRLVLASSEITEITGEFSIRGHIPEIDKAKKTFTVVLNNGQKLEAKYESQHFEPLLYSFNDYESGQRVLITGIGKFDKTDKLKSIETIDHISKLDQLDIMSRLEELADLKDGWYNGEGFAPKKENLFWFADKFETAYDASLPLPFLYPTVDGGLQAEWNSNGLDISIRISFDDKIGHYHLLNLDTDQEVSLDLNLESDTDWTRLNDELKGVLKSA